MHLIIPFAGAGSEACRSALADLELPHLRAWLARARVEWLDLPEGADSQAPELSRTPPHEHALAQALGWHCADGTVPLAALSAARAGEPPAGQAWGRLTPSHWQLGTEQVTLLDPQALALDEAESRAFLDAIRPLFEEEGYTLRWLQPHAWLVAHPRLADLPCASLDRVVGRNVDLWLAADPRARPLRRLQNEVQMLLHQHPLNTAREARGVLPLNSFWLDGCGVLPEGSGSGGQVGSSQALLTLAAQTVTVDDRLRTPALQDDAFGWGRAFGQLDDGPVARALQTDPADPAGPTACITLCGERRACALRVGPSGAVPLGERLRRWWAPTRMADVRRLLEAL